MDYKARSKYLLPTSNSAHRPRFTLTESERMKTIFQTTESKSKKK
jgi:hypothetical protein